MTNGFPPLRRTYSTPVLPTNPTDPAGNTHANGAFMRQATSHPTLIQTGDTRPQPGNFSTTQTPNAGTGGRPLYGLHGEWSQELLAAIDRLRGQREPVTAQQRHDIIHMIPRNIDDILTDEQRQRVQFARAILDPQRIMHTPDDADTVRQGLEAIREATHRERLDFSVDHGPYQLQDPHGFFGVAELMRWARQDPDLRNERMARATVLLNYYGHGMPLTEFREGPPLDFMRHMGFADYLTLDADSFSSVQSAHTHLDQLGIHQFDVTCDEDGDPPHWMMEAPLPPGVQTVTLRTPANEHALRQLMEQNPHLYSIQDGEDTDSESEVSIPPGWRVQGSFFLGPRGINLATLQQAIRVEGLDIPDDDIVNLADTVPAVHTRTFIHGFVAWARNHDNTAELIAGLQALLIRVARDPEFRNFFLTELERNQHVGTMYERMRLRPDTAEDLPHPMRNVAPAAQAVTVTPLPSTEVPRSGRAPNHDVSTSSTPSPDAIRRGLHRARVSLEEPHISALASADDGGRQIAGYLQNVGNNRYADHDKEGTSRRLQTLLIKIAERPDLHRTINQEVLKTRNACIDDQSAKLSKMEFLARLHGDLKTPRNIALNALLQGFDSIATDVAFDIHRRARSQAETQTTQMMLMHAIANVLRTQYGLDFDIPAPQYLYVARLTRQGAAAWAREIVRREIQHRFAATRTALVAHPGAGPLLRNGLLATHPALAAQVVQTSEHYQRRLEELLEKTPDDDAAVRALSLEREHAIEQLMEQCLTDLLKPLFPSGNQGAAP